LVSSSTKESFKKGSVSLFAIIDKRIYQGVKDQWSLLQDIIKNNGTDVVQQNILYYVITIDSY